MEIEFILCVIKDRSEWDSQILLFVVFNIIDYNILRRGHMSRIRKFALKE